MTRSARALLLLLPALLAPQEPAAAAPTLGELMRRLRSPESDWVAREEALDLLLEHHGAEGAKQAARHAIERLADGRARWERARDRYLRRFDKAAPQAVPALRVRKADEEIERLRREALAVTAREPLTKEEIVAEIDPRLARLGELLLVTPALVLASDARLQAERLELVFELDALRDWHLLWRRAADSWIRLDPEAAGAGAGPRGEPPQDPDPLQDALDLDEEWSAVLAAPMTDRDRETMRRNRERAAEFQPDEYEGILFHNRIRIQLGLHAQAVDPKLCAAGRDHSKDMKELGFFAHESPVEGKKTPGDRAARFGTSAGAENIAMGMRAPRDAILAWWHSPGHHKNMLGGSDRIGLGHFEGYWTEMFG